jgi:hypothetical protein
MLKTASFQEWASSLLIVLIVVVIALSGQSFMSWANPSVSSTTPCTLKTGTSGTTHLKVPSSIDSSVRSDLLGSSPRNDTSKLFTLNCDSHSRRRSSGSSNDSSSSSSSHRSNDHDGHRHSSSSSSSSHRSNDHDGHRHSSSSSST